MIRTTIAAVLLAMTATAFAQKQTAPAPATTATTSVTSPATTPEPDSRGTRDELRSLLRSYPPELSSVLRLDPSLLSNETYMANYPALAAFAKQHPEIQHNSAFFFEGAPGLDFRGGSTNQWRDIMGDVAAFCVFLVITFVLVWIVRTLIEQRRWNRLSAIQTEVHSKLMDRFTTNEELLAYLQSPAGKRLLESAPMPLEAAPRPMSAPVGRIFWSLQTGFVMIAAGVGFDLISLRVTGPDSAGLYGIGVIALLVGLALVLSAIVFYALSRRFGLWQPNVASSE